MNQDNDTYDGELLRRDLRQAREKLDLLVEDLRNVDRELGELDGERHRYGVLQQVCSGLDELKELGAEELFWGGQDVSGSSSDHVRLVRSRLDEFEKRIHEIEERRQTIFDEIQVQEDAADLIAGDVLEAIRLEEDRQFEWEIDREVDELPLRFSVMPWASGGEDDRRFRKALGISLLVCLLIGLFLPLIKIPLTARWEVLEEQDRLTRLIREEVPPPPVVAVEPAKPVVNDEPVPSESETPLVAEQPVPESAPAEKPAEKPSPESKGILAFRDKFSGLAESQDIARLGSNARISNPGELASGQPKRSMVTSQAATNSGGINVAALSRDTGGAGRELGGVAVAQATSSIGTGGGTDRPLSGGGPGLGRTDEEIQIVFDRHKAALYRLYNRELRKNPTLKGQIVLSMTIEPDGSVSRCEVKSTNMKAPALADQVVSRVKTFDFGAKEDIQAVSIVYPIDFLPAT